MPRPFGPALTCVLGTPTPLGLLLRWSQAAQAAQPANLVALRRVYAISLNHISTAFHRRLR